MEALKEKMKIDVLIQSQIEKEIGEDFRGPVLVGQAGSGRKYYRVWKGAKSFVLMNSNAEDIDFQRFLDCSLYLQKAGIGAPKIHGFSLEKFQVLMEDLGDLTLLEFVKNEGENRQIYRKVIELLVDFQRKGQSNLWELPQVYHRNFGYLDLLWETEYFYDHFLSRFLRLQPGEKRSLFLEFEELANRTDRHFRVLMHRDFQSQNLMVRGDSLRLIDYQGMRMGSEFYDLASMLWDPYTMLSPSLVEELFRYYFEVQGRIAQADDWTRFLEASLQRIMQACGAYGALSQIHGLRDFANYLEPGWQRLRFILELLQENEDVFSTLRDSLNRIDPEKLRF